MCVCCCLLVAWCSRGSSSFFIGLSWSLELEYVCQCVCAVLLMPGGLVLPDVWSIGAVELDCYLRLHVSSLLLNCCFFSFEFEKTIIYMCCAILYAALLFKLSLLIA
jgi:hypothetical protein